MLQEIKVSQFAIIDSLQIDFQPGLNILSGETGSGKSVLLKSLALLMGEKASTDIIRTGSPQAVVEGAFNLKKRPDIKKMLSEFGIDCPDDVLIVRRIIAGSSEKSKIYLNGSLSMLSQLRQVVSPMIEVTGDAAPLIEMTGQHDNRNLLSKTYHLDLLDQYAGTWETRSHYHEKFLNLQNLKNEIVSFEKQAQEKTQKLDFLKYQFQELEKLNIDLDVDLTIEDDIRKMKNSSKLLQFIDQCENLVYNDDDAVMTRLKTLQKKAMDLSVLDSSLLDKIQPLSQAQSLIDDTIYQLRHEFNKINLDSSILEEKEARLSQIRKLQKKYGPDLNELVLASEKMKKEILELENSDQHLDQLKKQVVLLELELKKMAESLHQVRVKSADKLITNVNHELLDLNMKGVRFDIHAEKLQELTATGLS